MRKPKTLPRMPGERPLRVAARGLNGRDPGEVDAGVRTHVAHRVQHRVRIGDVERAHPVAGRGRGFDDRRAGEAGAQRAGEMPADEAAGAREQNALGGHAGPQAP